jgi:hypothetical protein
MVLNEKAKKIVCRLCRAGVNERCLDRRPGYEGLRIKGVHAVRVSDVKAKGL